MIDDAIAADQGARVPPLSAMIGEGGAHFARFGDPAN